jgi:hypothetical protein
MKTFQDNYKNECPKSGIRQKYFQHSIFKTLTDIKEFYEGLSGNDESSTILAIKGYINVNWDIFASISNTVDSIITLLERGRVNDSIALMRKFNDAVIMSVYLLIMIEKGEKNFLEIDYASLYDNVLNQWVRGEANLIEKKDNEDKMEAYMTVIRERDYKLYDLLFSKQNKKVFGQGRSSFNDNIHYNKLDSFLWNNDAFLDYDTCISVLNEAENTIKLISAIHFAYVALIRPMALKAEDYSSSVAPFVDDFFQQYIVPKYSTLADYLKQCSFLTFDE